MNTTHDTILPVGTKTVSMISGFSLPVEIVERTSEAKGFLLGCEYKARYIGEKNVCLDFGQNWFARPGDIFTIRQGNIDRALEWKAKGY
jgi:hypothetical protein